MEKHCHICQNEEMKYIVFHDNLSQLVHSPIEIESDSIKEESVVISKSKMLPIMWVGESTETSYHERQCYTDS